jgi:hypothetical protein
MTETLAATIMTRFRVLSNALRLSPLATMLLALLATLDLAALAFAVGAVVGADEGPAPPRTEWRPPALLASAPSRAKVASDGGETLSRPIFWKSRRPKPPTPADDERTARRPAASAAGLSLAAIVKTGATTRVFIVSSGSPDGKWLTRGETIEGWTVSEIGDIELTLVDGERSARLPLYAETEAREPLRPEGARPDGRARMRGESQAPRPVVNRR